MWYRTNRFGKKFVGYVTASYTDLISAFGRPCTGNDKSQAQFSVEFIDDDGCTSVATIYDWNSGDATEKITLWCVAADNSDTIDFVEDAILYARDMDMEHQQQMYQWDLDWYHDDRRDA